MYFVTLTEIPILQDLMEVGSERDQHLHSYLLTGAISSQYACAQWYLWMKKNSSICCTCCDYGNDIRYFARGILCLKVFFIMTFFNTERNRRRPQNNYEGWLRK